MLQGLHLVAFEPDSIMVTTSCLEEINHLRAAYRPDPYPLPVPPKTCQKCKLTGSTQHNEPKPKNPCGAITDSPNKLKESSLLVQVRQLSLRKPQPIDEQPDKKACGINEVDIEFLYQEPGLPYKFHE